MKKRFRNWKKPEFDEDGWAYPDWNCIKHKKNQYGWRCQYPKGLKLGENVDIGCFTYLNARYGIEIGDNVQIGAHCAIYSDNTENETHGKITIEKNSLIGSYTLILPGVIIPPDSKIRARSVIK